MNEQQDFIKRINECVELAIDQENVIFEDQLFLIFLLRLEHIMI